MYSDEKAATTLYGKADKRILTTTPFVGELEYGQSRDGYWTYDLMVVQLEDCIDVLQHLYPNFDFYSYWTTAMVTIAYSLMG